MPDEPIKFRCYRCGKLLGAPPRRMGAVVTCPRCRSELEVPAPSDAGPPAAESGPLGEEEVAVEPDFSAIIAPPTGDIPIPPIRIDPTPPGLTATPAPRSPDVVLPPGVVMAWSLLVLMAVPMAFIAGLLIGRFVWK
jgi:hypothetical protein